jgi:hypothetical protein
MSIQDPSLAGVDYGAQRDQGLITSATFLGSRPPQFAGGLPDPESISVEIVQRDQIERDYRDMSEQQRKSYSQLLRDAGFRVPLTGKYNINVRNALVQAYDEFDLEVRDLSSSDPSFFQNNDYDLTKYLRDRQNRGEGAGGSQTIRYRQDPTDEALERGIDEVYKELLGRGASKDESRRYAKKIRQQLNKVENMAQSTIVDVGGGVQQRTDRAGFDTNAFLYEQLGGNEEVKTRKIFSFYDTFKQALGVS